MCICNPPIKSWKMLVQIYLYKGWSWVKRKVKKIPKHDKFLQRVPLRNFYSLRQDSGSSLIFKSIENYKKKLLRGYFVRGVINIMSEDERRVNSPRSNLKDFRFETVFGGSTYDFKAVVQKISKLRKIFLGGTQVRRKGGSIPWGLI